MQLLEWSLVKHNANDAIFVSLNYVRTITLAPLAFNQTPLKQQRNIDIVITLTFLKACDLSPHKRLGRL